MIDVFVDESIHDRAGMIVTSLVFATEGDILATALRDAALEARVEEHKSSGRMDAAPHLQALRSRLFGLMMDHGCRLGTVVSARTERHLIADHAGQLIAQVVATTGIDDELQVYFDEGIQVPRVGTLVGEHARSLDRTRA